MASQSLSARLDRFAEAWRPTEAGEKLIGRVVDVDLRDSEYGEPYPIVTIETDDRSEFAFHAFHTIARRELARQRPHVGDRIGIAYHGRAEPSKPGLSGAERYRIIVERAEPEPVNWDAVAPEGDAADDDEPIPF